jgi:hypothetical protein
MDNEPSILAYQEQLHGILATLKYPVNILNRRQVE